MADHHHFPHDLSNAAQEWQTPGTDSFWSRGGERKDEMGLDQQARAMWVTPEAKNFDKPQTPASQQLSIGQQARSLWSTPHAHNSQGAPGAGLTENDGRRRDLVREADTWPTPLSEDSEGAGKHPQAQDSLTGVTAHWKTPRASDKDGASQVRVKSGDGQLREQVERLQWKTPTANEDAAGTVDGQMQQMLTHQAKRFLPSHPGPATSTPGDESLQSALTLRRQLNPAFVEWLMGWGTQGWTSLAPLDCESPETASCQQLPRSPSALSGRS